MNLEKYIFNSIHYLVSLCLEIVGLETWEEFLSAEE